MEQIDHVPKEDRIMCTEGIRSRSIPSIDISIDILINISINIIGQHQTNT